jgi:hypothetical protein
VRLCAESFGNPADPPILLIAGSNWEPIVAAILAQTGGA